MSDPIHRDPHNRDHTEHKFWASKPELVAHRRELVARLRIRGLSMREIVAALAKPGATQLLNPNTGEPFTLATVRDDCKALDAEWRTRTAEAVDDHRARVFVRLEEVQRQGWTDKDMNVVLRALKQECDVLGLDAPIQYKQVFEDEVQRIATETGTPAAAVWAEIERAVAKVG